MAFLTVVCVMTVAVCVHAFPAGEDWTNWNAMRPDEVNIGTFISFLALKSVLQILEIKWSVLVVLSNIKT